ncbi:hypothetical protein CBR_g51468 [Chara braunii]|uniref:Uncharacterized protein n=1 Tax=Chara braunii TaxID=69332 RepID=A0A388K6D7_CHABU|nr:hypothetical protein CBR_g51468 [Chara braunii]|eukprot:GBG65586.1 hypothetical protein CBR_g51468 [Chara braunii]
MPVPFIFQAGAHLCIFEKRFNHVYGQMMRKLWTPSAEWHGRSSPNLGAEGGLGLLEPRVQLMALQIRHLLWFLLNTAGEQWHQVTSQHLAYTLRTRPEMVELCLISSKLIGHVRWEVVSASKCPLRFEEFCHLVHRYFKERVRHLACQQRESLNRIARQALAQPLSPSEAKATQKRMKWFARAFEDIDIRLGRLHVMDKLVASQKAAKAESSNTRQRPRAEGASHAGMPGNHHGEQSTSVYDLLAESDARHFLRNQVYEHVCLRHTHHFIRRIPWLQLAYRPILYKQAMDIVRIGAEEDLKYLLIKAPLGGSVALDAKLRDWLGGIPSVRHLRGIWEKKMEAASSRFQSPKGKDLSSGRLPTSVPYLMGYGKEMNEQLKELRSFFGLTQGPGSQDKDLEGPGVAFSMKVKGEFDTILMKLMDSKRMKPYPVACLNKSRLQRAQFRELLDSTTRRAFFLALEIEKGEMPKETGESMTTTVDGKEDEEKKGSSWAFEHGEDQRSKTTDGISEYYIPDEGVGFPTDVSFWGGRDFFREAWMHSDIHSSDEVLKVEMGFLEVKLAKEVRGGWNKGKKG